MNIGGASLSPNAENVIVKNGDQVITKTKHSNSKNLDEQFRMNIAEASLSPNFENVILENGDLVIVRSNLKSMADVKEWVKELGIRTDTKWNSRNSRPAGERFVLWKKFVCQHSSFNKVNVRKSPKSISKNAACQASITIKIKLDTTHTRVKDDFVRRGLVAVITITPFHKHSLETAETLRFLPAGDCRKLFEEYFRNGMGPAEAYHYHNDILKTNPDLQPNDLVNSRVNPTKRTISYWHDQWRLLQPGSRNIHGSFEQCKKKTSGYSNNNNCNETPIYDVNGIAFSTSWSFPSDFSPEPDIQPESDSEKVTENLIKKFRETVEKFHPSEQAMKQALLSLEEISSKEECELMLNSLSSNVT